MYTVYTVTPYTLYTGEFGCTSSQNASTGRYTWYKAHRDAIEAHGFAAAVWDDDGMYVLWMYGHAVGG